MGARKSYVGFGLLHIYTSIYISTPIVFQPIQRTMKVNPLVFRRTLHVRINVETLDYIYSIIVEI